jgi:hypothetical protein
MFVNGVQDATVGNRSDNLPDSTVYIGADPGDAFDGVIAEAFIADCSLRAEHSARLYAGESPNTVVPCGSRVAYWPMRWTAAVERDVWNGIPLTEAGGTVPVSHMHPTMRVPRQRVYGKAPAAGGVVSPHLRGGALLSGILRRRLVG